MPLWLAIRCREFSFLLITLQILLTCSSNFSSESKIIQSNFSLRLDVIDALSKRISLCAPELKVTWHFPRLVFIWLFLQQSDVYSAIFWSFICSLLLCCSKSRARSLHSIAVPTLQNLSSFFLFTIWYILTFLMNSNIGKIRFFFGIRNIRQIGRGDNWVSSVNHFPK